MAEETNHIVVDVPLREAYNQWTQFEEFPRFMRNVKQVQQLDDQHLHWLVDIGGQDLEWDAEITEQVPDHKIAWRSINGAMNAGTVTFKPLAPNQTEVHFEMSYEPEGVLQRMGETLGIMNREVKEDLKEFKDFLEARGTATGAWRGRIPSPKGSVGAL